MLSEKELASIVENDILKQIDSLDRYGFSLENIQSILDSIQEKTMKKRINVAFQLGIQEGLGKKTEDEDKPEYIEDPVSPGAPPVFNPNKYDELIQKRKGIVM